LARVKHKPQPDFTSPMPFEVTRWGKFWALEPLFADDRQWLVAKGGPTVCLGDVVLAEPHQGNRLRIVEVLGHVDDLAAVLKALMYAQHLRQGFAEDVLDEARAATALSARADPDRRDLAGLPTFTIDPDSARDFDDAISVRGEGGSYRAWVHIADVSYFVSSGGAIDLEARRRTSSAYLPLWAEPMLPRELSSGVCSLKPREPRKCLTVELELDAAGEQRGVRFYRSLIHSDHRLTYGFVDELLADHGVDLLPAHLPGEPPRSAGEDVAAEAAATAQEPGAAATSWPAVEGATFHADGPLTDHLLLAWKLADILRRRRFARGALRIGSFEPEYRFDSSGRLIGASSRPETPSHALVEEYMLAANEAVARYLVGRRAHAIYRVHEPPDADAADGLMAALEELGVPTPPFPEAQKASAEQVSAALRRLSDQLPRFCAREGRGRLAFPQLLLRSLKQARYGPENLGHFGLASSAYLHFTSPIRRYPDLVVHRALCAHLGLDGDELPEGVLGAVADECSQQERTIARLELKADDVALSFLLEQRLGELGWETVFDGEVVGLIGPGLFVHFGGTYQGFVPARRLGDERFYESPTGATLIGVSSGKRYRLGDAISVTVERIEKARGRVTLDLAGHAGAEAERDRQAAGGGSARGGSRGKGGRPGPRRQAGRPRSTRRA
jgi:ribonuclease R